MVVAFVAHKGTACDEVGQLRELAMPSRCRWSIAWTIQHAGRRNALAWCLKNPNMSTVILGASKLAQLEENLKAVEAQDLLSADVMARVEGVAWVEAEHVVGRTAGRVVPNCAPHELPDLGRHARRPCPHR